MKESLHTKYRPKTFDEVVGQDKAVKSLQKVLADGSCRSFIFTGDSGQGKTTLARIVATSVGCTQNNLIEVDAATNTGIDAMRQVTDGIQYVGLGDSPVRVYVIDEAHALSKSAWDSLLKVVEEPPDHVYWCFCTTVPAKIPATIRTRCVNYDLKPVSKELIYKLIRRIAKKEGYETSKDVLFALAEASQGSPRRAITTLSLCSDCKSRKEASKLIKASSEDGDVIHLCRSLMKGAGWDDAITLLNTIKDQNAEGIRIVICSYFEKVALSSPKMAKRCVPILAAFAQPYPQSNGVYPVLISLADLYLGE